MPELEPELETVHERVESVPEGRPKVQLWATERKLVPSYTQMGLVDYAEYFPGFAGTA